MRDRPLTLAIDFDGTIHNTENKKPGYKMGVPIEGAAEALKQLKSEGALIVIHSLWGDTPERKEAIAKWCRYFDIPFDDITRLKPNCDLYIDNRGLHFQNWKQTLEEISSRT